MKKILLFMVMTAFISTVAMAATLNVGDSLPELILKGDSEDKLGKLVLNSDKITYADFNSAELKGKMRSVLYIAATMSAASINEAFADALKTANLPTDKYQTVIIMNLDEAMWGTGGIVKGKIEDKQKEVPNSMFANDEDGDGLKKWGIKTDYAVMVIDQMGKIVAYKDDKLTEQDIRDFIDTIRKGL